MSALIRRVSPRGGAGASSLAGVASRLRLDSPRPLVLGHAAPDAVRLAYGQRVGTALADHRAAGADLLGGELSVAADGPRSPSGGRTGQSGRSGRRPAVASPTARVGPRRRLRRSPLLSRLLALRSGTRDSPVLHGSNIREIFQTYRTSGLNSLSTPVAPRGWAGWQRLPPRRVMGSGHAVAAGLASAATAGRRCQRGRARGAVAAVAPAGRLAGRVRPGTPLGPSRGPTSAAALDERGRAVVLA